MKKHTEDCIEANDDTSVFKGECICPREYKIGTKYLSVGKERTIIDILKTYNSKGVLVRLRYVSVHSLMGQVIEDRDVCPLTIQKALWYAQQKES